MSAAIKPVTNWAKLGQFPRWIKLRKRCSPPLRADAVAKAAFVPPLASSASRERMRGARFTASIASVCEMPSSRAAARRPPARPRAAPCADLRHLRNFIRLGNWPNLAQFVIGLIAGLALSRLVP